MWTAMVVAALILVAVIVGFFGVRSAMRDPDRAPVDGDQLFMLGVIFLGAGVALFVSVGPAMLGMPVLGAIFMAVGAQRRRSDGHE